MRIFPAARSTADLSPVPDVTAEPVRRAGGRQRIVVGVDGSAASIDALRWAATYAALTDARVEAVTSWEMSAASGMEFGTGDCDWEDNARSTLTTALQQALGKAALTVMPTVVRGGAAQVLVDASDKAALLVVGSRGHGAFVGMLIGSVSEYVIAHAGCPVVVIRHPADVRQVTPGPPVPRASGAEGAAASQ